MKRYDKTKGFTIIEVVLVLAIAGLIFMMVFVALPALQRSQRDTARKSDVSTVASLVESYSSNNRGSLPVAAEYAKSSSPTSGFGAYLTEILVNNAVNVINPTSTIAAVATAEDTIVVITNSECSTTASTPTYKQGRTFTVVTKLETGGGSYYCLNG